MLFSRQRKSIPGLAKQRFGCWGWPLAWPRSRWHPPLEPLPPAARRRASTHSTPLETTSQRASGRTDPNMWVADWEDDNIFTYKMSDKSRDAAKDFDTLNAAGNNKPRGIWSDGTTMWVVDSQDKEEKIFAYRLSDAAVLSSLSLSPAFDGGTARYTGTVFGSDIQTTVTATAAQSGASVVVLPADADTATPGHQAALAKGVETAVTITVTPSSGDARVYTVAVANLFTARNPTQDFDTLAASQNTAPRSLWSDGETMWVADS